MDFGIFLSYQRIYRPEDYRTSLFEEKRIEAAAAERLGSTWLGYQNTI